MEQSKRFQMLVTDAVPCGVGEGPKHDMIREEKFLAKLSAKGCPEGCSCTHINEATNKVFGRNL